MIQFDETICRRLNVALQREWLETNGLGGFASSTITGLNTRRYHGLLVAATKPPVGRMVLLSKLEETLVIDGQRYDLSANRYPGVVHPQGYLYLKEFRLDPFPTFTYEVADLELVKTIFMVQGENSTVVQFQLRTSSNMPRTCTLELRPLIAFRDYHSTTHENDSLNAALEHEDGLVKMTPYEGVPSLYFAHTAGELTATGAWYRNFEYDIERDRGLDYREDLFNPFLLSFDLVRDAQPALIASTERRHAAEAAGFRAAEIRRRQAGIAAGIGADPLVQDLLHAAGQFIVARGEQSTVIAGYHWFSDWGRDTMIALPGLTLATGHPETAKSILLAFAAHVDRGMLPNRFPDASESPEYNTVDATLWFFEAVRALAADTGDYEFVRRHLYDTLAGIVACHERGTRYGIRVDSDGLLQAGESGAQLTWMDAKVGDWVVTPRHGKPVEIQALWYNALRTMEDLALRFGRSVEQGHFADVATRAAHSFNDLFWNEEGGCLFDVVDQETRAAAIRPNQIFAVSLFHSMLPVDRAQRVVNVVAEHLLTPYGLRSLSPRDSRYRGRYEGDAASRDSAYHQGTVWPWLLGPFLKAFLMMNAHSTEAIAQAKLWMKELHRYSQEEGTGQIPEVFDGDAPQRPGGCMAQAWSVAELLRVYVEDIANASSIARRQAQANTAP